MPGSMVISNANTDGTDLSILLNNFSATIESDLCPDSSSVKTCEVTDLTIDTGRRRRLRRLQSSDDLILKFTLLIEAICNIGCTNAEAVGNAVYSQVSGDLLDAINDGSLITSLKKASPALTSLLESSTVTGDFGEVVIPILDSLIWYPNWKAQTCKNDGEYP